MAIACMVLLCARFVDAQSCPGDCNGDGEVSINELIIGVNIALGAQAVTACTAMDSNGDGAVTVNELIRAVSMALNGCPARTVTPTAAATDTETPTPPPATDTPAATPTSPPATETAAATPLARLCDLPGSIQMTDNGVVVVPGGQASAPDFRFMQLPVGFCAHYFATIGNTRQLRFAPGGELFVASPTTPTTGGGQGGRSAIMVLADDDHDGYADAPITFLGGTSAPPSLRSTQGLLFTGGFLYYQNGTKIMRVPYATGDRAPSGPSEQMADITYYFSSLHWPKTLDAADDGTIYVANGGDQGEACDPTRPFHGGIRKLDGTPDGGPVAKGFRNPISVRCGRGHNRCFAVELAKDFTTFQGGREKLIEIHQDDDWGFPCCATKDLPYVGIQPAPDCSGVAADSDSFMIGETPFDVDFETGKWPAPWAHRAYLPLHGVAGAWDGARVVAIAMDPTTGELMPASTLPAGPPGSVVDFAIGWDDGKRSHGRPANVAFAADGRLFLGNDNTGDIVWIAPVDLQSAP